MSEKVCRLGDYCTGHTCWPPRPNDQGSPNVFINGLAAHRKGDHWINHTCTDTHDSHLAEGSSKVFVNNKELGRVTDPILCGSFVADGSPNVFSG